MTQEVQVAFINNVPLIIGAIGVILVQIYTHRSANRQRVVATEQVKVAAEEQKIDAKTADAKLDHITVLTNSTLTAANDRIKVLEGAVERLIAGMTATARASEQAAIALADQPDALVHPAPAPGVPVAPADKPKP